MDFIVKNFSLGLALVGLVNVAFASDWVEVTKGVKSSVSVDRDSVAQAGRLWKAWVKTDFEIAQETDGYPKKFFKQTKYLQYFNCAEKTSAIVKWYAYGDAGQLVDSSEILLNAAQLTEPIPDTVGEDVSKTLCEYVLMRKPAGKAK